MDQCYVIHASGKKQCLKMGSVGNSSNQIDNQKNAKEIVIVIKKLLIGCHPNGYENTVDVEHNTRTHRKCNNCYK